MENTKLLKRRLLAVLKGALLGAAISDGLVLWVNVTPELFKRMGLTRLWDDWFGLLPYVIVLPTMWVDEAIGWRSALLNIYVVNGLLGTVLFAAAATLWQFAVKSSRENIGHLC